MSIWIVLDMLFWSSPGANLFPERRYFVLLGYVIAFGLFMLMLWWGCSRLFVRKERDDEEGKIRR
jgi:hypothetical protein